MHIITLLTDWQNDDYYKAVVKASVLSKIPDIQFVDISHQVNTFHISQAVFLLKSSINQFPEGSIHFFGIQTVSSNNSPIIVAQVNKQYIVANDNGIFDALDIKFDRMVKIEVPISNFPVAEHFVPIAIKIIEGEELTNIGTEITSSLEYPTIKPTLEDDKIIIPITYIDSYGNLILNIQKDFFEKECQNRRFDIFINSFKFKTSTIHQHYNEVPKSEIFAIFNSAGWLEIGMRMANISQILNLNGQSNIIIKFYND